MLRKAHAKICVSGAFLLLAAATGFAVEDQDCLGCHGEPALTAERNGEIIHLYVDESIFAASAHGDDATYSRPGLSLISLKATSVVTPGRTSRVTVSG